MTNPIPVDGVRAVLLDIEGTISPIAFVKDVMFPRAAAALPAFVEAHAGEPDVEEALAGVRETVRAEDGVDLPVDDRRAAVDRLLAWIAADRKHPALKSLQGRIWQSEFEAGRLVAPLYSDVRPALEALHGTGRAICVYSSGSALAQRMFFRYSDHGDLSPLVDRYFDLAVGSKLSRDSYLAIAAELSLPPNAILFLTDNPAEVTAARAAGTVALLVVRPGAEPPAGESSWIRDFDALAIR